ncbi:hypothetical protein M9H77_23808 [Catharanthus roseus]|uniref:Uncharacterized protein n=1 Tax=Catharanthus roseus TaxID=4058 RepID=A0ACC0AVV2_CATRO|nr:hypothetical protein M9H77_23808 [Catharanthus roseus]
MDSEIRSVTDLLHQISTGPVSKVREMHHLAKGVLSSGLPKDSGVALTSPPEVAVTRGRKKTNSTKRDKSHWEHGSIAHQKIQKSSGSSSGSGSGSGSDSGSGSRRRGRLPRAPRGRGKGRARGRSSLSSVVDPYPCSIFPYTNAFPAFIYPFISNWKNIVGDGNCGYRDGPVPLEHWLETPDSFYIIANASNLCVVLIAQLGSTIVLPLYSYSDRPGGTLVIGLLTE